MKLTCIALGSRGDVQPYLALGVGLKSAGFEYTLVSHTEFASLAREHGLGFHSAGGDPKALMETDLAQAMLASGGNPLRFMKQLAELSEPIFERAVTEAIRACEEADGIIYSNIGVFAHRLAQPPLPYCSVMLQPFTPTSQFASAFFPRLPASAPFGEGLYNRLTHQAFLAIFWHCFGRPFLKLQRERGLRLPTRAESWQARKHLICYAYSPSLIPRPNDWPANIHVPGYLYLPEPPGWEPPPALTDFLASGPAPVYVGFGSMRSERPAETAELVLEALRQTGLRGVLHRGWGGVEPADVPDSVLLVESVPHYWLLPRMAAVVHHGGAGTTAAGLRAGVPSVLVPHFADQPFWGRTVYQAGVSPQPIQRKQLSVRRLIEALRQATTDGELRQHAAALGARIRAEQGVEETVRLVAREFRAK